MTKLDIINMSDIEAQMQSSNSALVTLQQKSGGNEIGNVNQNQSQPLFNTLDEPHAEQNAASTVITPEETNISPNVRVSIATEFPSMKVADFSIRCVSQQQNRNDNTN